MPLKLENAAKRVGNRWIYRDVTLDVADGEVFGLFGRAGGGKSEIVRSFDVPVANGTSIPLLKRLAGHTVKASERVDALQKAIDKASGPLILDAPFSGLDPLRKEEIADQVRAVAKQKRIPVLFCTSDFSDVTLAADRTAAFIDGYIRQTGTPRELYDEPATRAVAVLTGRHNLIEARRLTSSKSELPEFQTIEGGHRLFTQKMELRKLGAIHKNAWLAIRPEQVSISFGASFPEDNLLKAVITGVKFRGAATYVCLDCDGLPLESMVTRLIGLNPGDQCMAALPPDRLRVLTD